MKKNCFIPMLAAATCLAVGFSFAGCDADLSANNFERYNDVAYSVGDGQAAVVSKIDVEWVAGDITVAVSPSAQSVTFSEKADGADEDLLLRSRFHNGTLDLKYASSRAQYPAGFSKDLTIVVPSAALTEISVETVSGRIVFQGVSAREISVDTISGDATAEECTFSDFEFESVSGSLDLLLSDVGFRCEFETVSGKYDDEFGSTVSGDVHLYGNGAVAISADTVSGSVSIRRSGQQQGGQGGEQGGTQPGGQGGEQGGTQPGGQGGEQGGTQPGGQGGEQGGTQPGGQGGEQGGTQPGGQGGEQGGQTGDPTKTERYERYEDAYRYTAGGGSVNGVLEIEIHWLGGEVVVCTSPTAQAVTFEETGADGQPLRYLAERGELEIRYAESGGLVAVGMQKRLVVTLPASYALSSLEIESRGDVRLEGVSARDISVETSGGAIAAIGCGFLDGEFETYAKDVELAFAEIGFSLEFTTFTGKLSDGFGAVPRGRGYVYGNGMVEISVETVSGSLTLRKL